MAKNTGKDFRRGAVDDRSQVSGRDPGHGRLVVLAAPVSLAMKIVTLEEGPNYLRDMD